MPSSWRMSALMCVDKSNAHDGHANWMGREAMSGVTSNANLEPHTHWIFIGQGFGFNSTTRGGWIKSNFKSAEVSSV